MSETHAKILSRDLGKAVGCGLPLVLFRVRAFSLSQTRPSRSLEQAKFSSISRKGMWFSLRYACVVVTVLFKRSICFSSVLFHSISCVILGFPFLEWK